MTLRCGVLFLAMALLSRSALIAVALTAGLLTAVPPGEAASSCAFAGGGSAGTDSLGDGPTGFFSSVPDGAALGLALGGLGAIAALLSGGALLGRRLGSPTEAGLENAIDENAIETETVLIAEPAEIETEVALALRR
jgi:hypothetical protein